MITNVRSLSEVQLSLSYKQQPAIERRFEQMKTEFVVAPMYLKEKSRIQALQRRILRLLGMSDAFQG